MASEVVYQCLTASEGVFHCLATSEGVPKCLTMSKNVSMCLSISDGVHEDPSGFLLSLKHQRDTKLCHLFGC